MPRASQDRRQPDFVVRAPDSTKRGRWVTVGVAWTTELHDKSTGYSIKLNSIPVGEWNGTLMLLPPLADRDEESALRELEPPGWLDHVKIIEAAAAASFS